MTNIETFFQSLHIMLYGMLGIFTIIIVIYIAIAILNKVTSNKAEK